MEAIGQLWQQYGAAHPIISHILVALIAPYFLSKLEAMIPRAVDWLEDYQERALKKAGLSPEQILALEERELKDLRASADELEKRIAAKRAVLSATAAP